MASGLRRLLLGRLTSGRSDSCKGYCKDYENSYSRKKNFYHDSANCRCSICDIYLKWEGNYCPCCGYRVRRRPRGSHAAIKCQIQRGVKRIE